MVETINKVWVYIDHFKGQALPASWEVLSAGFELAKAVGGGVSGLIFGHQTEALQQQTQAYGADEILLADDETLADFRLEPYASLLAKLAGEGKPDFILFPTTTRGRDLAAMAAVDLDTGVIPDVIHMEMGEDNLLATRPVYAGKLLEKVSCPGKPQLITIRSRIYDRPKKQSATQASCIRVQPALTEAEIPTTVTSRAQAESRVNLTDAAVVVSGGRGVANNPLLQPPAGLEPKQAEVWRAQQGFNLIRELAEVLGGAVGASRAAVDAGYIAYPHQVGQTGKLISPDLYIACGISGAIQHLAGMRTSKVIVAINKDSEAPIFKHARFGVVGDLFEILPALIQEFRSRLGNQSTDPEKM